MPRSKYNVKNRFVRNSNLSERVFLAIVRQWLTPNSETSIAKTVSRWARVNNEQCLSRQTVSKYNTRLSLYLAQKHIEPMFGNDIKLLETSYYAAYAIASNQYIYSVDRENNAVPMPIISKEISNALALLYKNSRGINLEKTRKLFARAYFLAMVEDQTENYGIPKNRAISKK